MEKDQAETMIELGSGNVFADLGFPNAEEHLAKAQLVYAIGSAIKARGLTQIEAAQLMEIDQPKVSKLLRGHFRSVSSDKLIAMLNRLGQDVVITIVASPAAERRTGHTSVAMTQRL